MKSDERLIELALQWRFERDEDAWTDFIQGLNERFRESLDDVQREYWTGRKTKHPDDLYAEVAAYSTRRWSNQAKDVLEEGDLLQEARLAVVEWVLSLVPPIAEPLDVLAEVSGAFNQRFSYLREQFVRRGTREGRVTRKDADTRCPKERYLSFVKGQLLTEPCVYRNPAAVVGTHELLHAVLQACETDEQREFVLLLAENPTDAELGKRYGLNANAARSKRIRFQAKLAYLLEDWGWCLRHDQKTISPPPEAPTLKRRVDPYPKPSVPFGRVVPADPLDEEDESGELEESASSIGADREDESEWPHWDLNKDGDCEEDDDGIDYEEEDESLLVH